MDATERNQAMIRQHAEQLRADAMSRLCQLAAHDEENGFAVGHSQAAIQAAIDDMRQDDNCGIRLLGLLAEIGLSETLGQSFIEPQS